MSKLRHSLVRVHLILVLVVEVEVAAKCSLLTTYHIELGHLNLEVCSWGPK